MLERKYGWTIEADIHGMRVLEAKRELETLIGRADKSIREIVVIHGYHGGSALKIWSAASFGILASSKKFFL